MSLDVSKVVANIYLPGQTFNSALFCLGTITVGTGVQTLGAGLEVTEGSTKLGVRIGSLVSESGQDF